MKIVAIAAAALLLTACATTPTTHLQQGKADAAAWDALHGVASTLDSLALSGTLHGAQAATAKVDLDKATVLLTAADAAYRAGNDANAQQNVATATVLISDLLTIVTQAKGH